MATPHIAGAVALLWSAHPELRNDPEASRGDASRQLGGSYLCPIAATAASPTTPNNTFGNGRIDILAAVDSVMVDTVAITKAQYSISRSQLTVLATEHQHRRGLDCLGRQVRVRSSGRWTPEATAITSAKINGIANPQNVTVTSNLGGSDSSDVRAR